MIYSSLNQASDNVLFLPESLYVLAGLVVLGVWLVWFFTTLGIRQEQNELRDEMKWRLDKIIELLKKKN